MAAPAKTTSGVRNEPKPGRAPEKQPLLEAARQRFAALHDLLKQKHGVQDVEFVHDLRVVTRRLGEVARVIARTRGGMDKPSADAVQGSLKALRKSMGNLRDSDVMVDHLRKARLPAPLRLVAEDLARRHHAEREGLAAAAEEQIRSASMEAAMVVLAHAFEQPPEASARMEREMEKALNNEIRKRQKGVKKAFAKAVRRQTAESLHEARIAVKKLRYLVELSQVFTRGAGKQARQLKAIQQILGDHHDAHVIHAEMEKSVKQAGKGEKKLMAAWRKWCRDVEQAQAKRAASFFAKSYAWMNG